MAAAGFVVTVPESTHLKAKRIALGQIVLIYVVAFIKGEKAEAVLNPVHVAASTAIGVAASLLALLLPFPRLACSEVKESCKLLAENTSARLKLYIRAFCAEDNASAVSSISQATLLASSATKLHQTIKRYQESIKWERPPFKFLRPYYSNLSGEKLQDVERSLRAMEMALTSTNSSLPVRTLVNGDIKEGLKKLEEHFDSTMKIAKGYLSSDSSTVPEAYVAENSSLGSFQTLQTIPSTHQDLSSFFFVFSIKLLQSKLFPKPSSCSSPDWQDDLAKNKTDGQGLKLQEGFSLKKEMSDWIVKARTKMFMPAFKLSLSLGLATLFGLIYSKENGYWSGLPVAISLAAGREATFKIANVKAQGTVLGSVYGVLGCFVFERYLPVRFLSLLPWFIFTSFLSRSVMYGQAGGISSAIGALLILGRKNFGPPSEFAIARITETFIGLSCSIFVDLLFQPTRASTLAKAQLPKIFGVLHRCINSVNFDTKVGKKISLTSCQNKLKARVGELEKFVAEAEVEPNFWFLPFHSACYRKLLRSLSAMADLLLFGNLAIGFLKQESEKYSSELKETLQNKLDGDLKLFKDLVVSLLKDFEHITSIKSLAALEKSLEKNNVSWDLEMGSSKSGFFKASGSDHNEEEDEVDKILSPFLRDAAEVVEKIHGVKGDEEDDDEEEEEEREVIIQMVVGLTALGFCMKGIVREAREIEEGIKELVQWENPTYHVNLHEVSCKIQALYK